MKVLLSSPCAGTRRSRSESIEADLEKNHGNARRRLQEESYSQRSEEPALTLRQPDPHCKSRVEEAERPAGSYEIASPLVHAGEIIAVSVSDPEKPLHVLHLVAPRITGYFPVNALSESPGCLASPCAQFGDFACAGQPKINFCGDRLTW